MGITTLRCKLGSGGNHYPREKIRLRWALVPECADLIRVDTRIPGCRFKGVSGYQYSRVQVKCNDKK